MTLRNLTCTVVSDHRSHGKADGIRNKLTSGGYTVSMERSE